MKRALTAIVLIPGVLAAVLWAPDWLFILLTGSVALLTAEEYLRIVAAHGIPTFRRTALVMLGAMFATAALYAYLPVPFNTILYWVLRAGVPLLALLVLATIFLFGLAMFSLPLRSVLPSVAATWLAFLYVGFPLASVVLIRAMSWYLAAFLLFSVWAGDILAYYVGSSIGKHYMAPTISPKKTWEGAVASLLSSALVGGVLWYVAVPLQFEAQKIGVHTNGPAVFEQAPVWLVLVISVVINIAAQLGDLAESAMKRGAEIKDSGGLLPGHGGMLDRVDALLFAAPVAMLLFVIFRVG